MNQEDFGCHVIVVLALLTIAVVVACVMAHMYLGHWPLISLILSGISVVSCTVFHVVLAAHDFKILVRFYLLIASVCLLLALPLFNSIS